MTRRTPSERLLDRLRSMGLDLPADTRIERTHAGPAQRASGAWSWYAWSDTPGNLASGGYLGSHEPVTALLKEPRLCASKPIDDRSYNSPHDLTVEAWSPRDRRDSAYYEEPEA